MGMVSPVVKDFTSRTTLNHADSVPIYSPTCVLSVGSVQRVFWCGNFLKFPRYYLGRALSDFGDFWISVKCGFHCSGVVKISLNSDIGFRIYRRVKFGLFLLEKY